MTRLAPLLLLLLLSGCVAYPRPHLAKKKGRAFVEDGRPLRMQASLVRECERTSGDSYKEGRRKEFMTDAQGRYQVRLLGVAFNYRNFITHSVCASRVQLYACREVCRPVDDIDLEVLGK